MDFVPACWVSLTEIRGRNSSRQTRLKERYRNTRVYLQTDTETQIDTSWHWHCAICMETSSSDGSTTSVQHEWLLGVLSLFIRSVAWRFLCTFVNFTKQEFGIWQSNNIQSIIMLQFQPRWPSGTVPDLRSRGRGFESHQRLLCTNANSACHPSGVG